MRDANDNIIVFSGEDKWASNFEPVQVQLINSANGEVELYRTVEHAYQASKTASAVERAFIRSRLTAASAKYHGRRVTMSEGWEAHKLDIMLNLLRQKFAQAPYQGYLLATGDVTITEGNWWGDVFWGRKIDRDGNLGDGENWLGQLIMRVREEIRG